MNIKRNISLILFVITNVMTNILFAQDLSKLSDSQRNQKLIEIATVIYKDPNFKNFYREFKTPTITSMVTRNLPANERSKISGDPKNIWYGSKNNQKFYIVYFHYDRSKERFEQDYAAKVYIWENTGTPFAIELGNMMMYPVRNGKTSAGNDPEQPNKLYTITYSKDVPDVAKLPKTGKYGDIITIILKNSTSVAYDGWTTEYGYNFNPGKDLTGGEVLSDNTRYITNSLTERTVQIMVTNNMQINVTSYRDEYEAPY